MDIRIELEKRIERERLKIVDLRAQLDRSDAFMQGLLEALKLLPKVPTSGDSRGAGPFRSGSDVEKAEQVLRNVGSPLHITDILNAIGKENTKNNRSSLSSQLARYARRGKMFRRAGPNMFGLVDNAAATKGTSQPQLPAEFGSEDEAQSKH